MRKIKNKEEIDKKKKKNQMIIGVTLVVLMMFSILGYSLSDKGNNTVSKVKEGDVTFVSSNGYWNIENTNLYFNYLPSELTNFSITGSYNFEDYADQPLYFVNYSIAGQPILNLLDGQISRYQEACLDTPCDKDFPVKSCNDSLMIIFSDSLEDKVYQNEKCVFISGDYLKGVDSFIYSLLGII